VDEKLQSKPIQNCFQKALVKFQNPAGFNLKQRSLWKRTAKFACQPFFAKVYGFCRSVKAHFLIKTLAHSWI